MAQHAQLRGEVAQEAGSFGRSLSVLNTWSQGGAARFLSQGGLQLSPSPLQTACFTAGESSLVLQNARTLEGEMGS